MNHFHTRSLRLAAAVSLLALPAAAFAQTWQRVGPLTAEVCSLAADPTTPSTLYAGLRSGGLWRSTDSGSLWSLLTSSPSRLCDLSVSRTDPQLLVALTSAAHDPIASTPVVSENGGATWTVRAPAGTSSFDVAAIAISQSSPEELYLFGRPTPGNVQRLWRSADRGRSWVTIDAGLPHDPNNGALAVDPGGAGRLVLGLQEGTYRSGDDGQTWTRIGAPPLVLAPSLLWFDPSPGGALFALGPYYEGLARSTDGGVTWQRTALGNLEVLTSITADPSSGNLFVATVDQAVGGLHVYRSTDAGLTWQPAAAPPLTLELGLLGTPSGLIGFAGGGVARSTDFAASWSLSNAGLFAGAIDDLAQGPSGELFASFDHAQSFRRAPNGVWQELHPPTDWIIHAAIQPQSGALLFDTGISTVNIVRSLDAGATWSVSHALECWSGTRSLFATASSLYLSADYTCYAGGTQSCALMRSDDLGDSWSCVANTRVARDYVGTDRSGNIVYATDGARLFRSTDRGVHLPVRGPLPKGAQQCAGIVVDPDHPNVLVCNSPRNLQWSNDGGKKWRRFGTNPGLAGKRFVLRGGPGGAVQLLGVAGRSDRDVLVYTSDGGKTWKELTPPWPATVLRKPLFDPTDPAAFLVGSDGAGVLRARL
ncbi:MAG TPA: hypothetical protein VGS57_10010 [Thermoanaerobaculia bacterium]|jgi:photosystem II stability/assembly factor-like uncharacterized protein|nr:hypothetical protein [Thermoanaerobaculia bacterium]